MMPSHSMDLPVPRGTSMLLLGGRFTSYGTKSETQMYPVCVTYCKYVSMSSSCFSTDGKSSFAVKVRPLTNFELYVLYRPLRDMKYCDICFNFKFDLCPEFAWLVFAK